MARDLRDMAHKAYWENSSERTWRTYCIYRNKVKKNLRKHKTKYWSNRFNSCSNSDEVWKVINSKRGKGYTNPFAQIEPDVFNDFFISSQSQHHDLPPDFSNFSNMGFCFRSINRDELIHSISQVKSNAVGTDNMPIKFIYKILPYIDKYLLLIFNTIIATSNYPDV